MRSGFEAPSDGVCTGCTNWSLLGGSSTYALNMNRGKERWRETEIEIEIRKRGREEDGEERGKESTAAMLSLLQLSVRTVKKA